MCKCNKITTEVKNISTSVYDSLVLSISQYNKPTNINIKEIMTEWNNHIKLLNTRYPGYNIKSISVMSTYREFQPWEFSNGINWLNKFKATELSLINNTYRVEGITYHNTIQSHNPMKRSISDNTIQKHPRKTIPKKIRGEAWKIQFGDSTKGSCFCCKKELDVFDDWHAGHIVSHSNNGTETAINLRPVCGSCNLSMGTENMDAFKARCYPN